MFSPAVLALVGLEEGLQFASEDHGLDATRIRIVRSAGVGDYDRHEFSALCRGGRSDPSGANGAGAQAPRSQGRITERQNWRAFFAIQKGVDAGRI